MATPGRSSEPGSASEWTETFYTELRDIARRAFADERKGHTLQPTAAVHEVCLRLMSGSGLPDLPRTERVALAARVLQQVLVDHHRGRAAGKRGGAMLRVEFTDVKAHDGNPQLEVFDLGVVHTALERLRALSPRQAEVVTLKIFGGLDMAAVARALGTSKRTAEADWTVARAWLRRELARALGDES